MARPLRIEFEGAWYHVMNRGINHNSVFNTESDRHLFLNILEETVKNYCIEIHSFCLMDNHYHLLIHTPHGNLSKAMRHINGVYTQKYNHLTNRDGPLFRGRYKSILIEDDIYLLQVSRYIHLNPVSAKICETPDQFQWSSYNYYINRNHELNWVKKIFILDMAHGIDNYIEYISIGIDNEIKNFYEKTATSSILGKQHFKNEQLQKIKENTEILPDINRTRKLPDINSIIQITATYFSISISELMKSRSGSKNFPQLVAIYLSRRLGLYSYQKIGVHFNKSLYAVNMAISRLNLMIKKDNSINDIVDEIIQKISISSCENYDN